MAGLANLRAVMRFRRPALPTRARALERAASIDDLRAMARRRVPRGVFDYVDGGAESERSLRGNAEAFTRRQWRPRVLADVGEVTTTTTLLGQPLALPLVVGPTGFTRAAHTDGELAVARAAARAGVPYTLSTLATRSIEEVAAVSAGRRWFQVYVWRDRGLLADLLARAAAAGYEAIVVTVDTAVLGRRERDVRRGFTLPPKLGPSILLDGIRHPAWSWDLLRSDPITFANVATSGVTGGQDPGAVQLAAFIDGQFDPRLSWRDLDWIRERWDGPILLKGIQSLDDAVLAADAGIDGVVLSNHGGRQLDGAPAPLDLVAPVVAAIGDRTEVICDGGVRRGGDIAMAVALGARAVMVGRAQLYGLAAAGEPGVDHALGLLASGLRRTMALVGAACIGDLRPDLVD